ncbi:MAG TPA: PilZ domain-containing protein [Vicinamibacterales bacterium]|nr:PilZ domain-containing protein [Vicinamibacterales bacterium]
MKSRRLEPQHASHQWNRRRYARLIGPYPGHWSLPNGPVNKGRVAQLSLNGCFVATPQTPNRGERVIVTVDAGDHPTMPLSGTVVNSRWSDGFGVKFDPLSPAHLEALNALMDTLRARRTTY